MYIISGLRPVEFPTASFLDETLAGAVQCVLYFHEAAMKDDAFLMSWHMIAPSSIDSRMCLCCPCHFFHWYVIYKYTHIYNIYIYIIYIYTIAVASSLNRDPPKKNLNPQLPLSTSDLY